MEDEYEVPSPHEHALEKCRWLMDISLESGEFRLIWPLSGNLF